MVCKYSYQLGYRTFANRLLTNKQIEASYFYFCISYWAKIINKDFPHKDSGDQMSALFICFALNAIISSLAKINIGKEIWAYLWFLNIGDKPMLSNISKR